MYKINKKILTDIPKISFKNLLKLSKFLKSTDLKKYNKYNNIVNYILEVKENLNFNRKHFNKPIIINNEEYFKLSKNALNIYSTNLEENEIKNILKSLSEKGFISFIDFEDDKIVIKKKTNLLQTLNEDELKILNIINNECLYIYYMKYLNLKSNLPFMLVYFNYELNNFGFDEFGEFFIKDIKHITVDKFLCINKDPEEIIKIMYSVLILKILFQFFFGIKERKILKEDIKIIGENLKTFFGLKNYNFNKHIEYIKNSEFFISENSTEILLKNEIPTLEINQDYINNLDTQLDNFITYLRPFLSINNSGILTLPLFKNKNSLFPELIIPKNIFE